MLETFLHTHDITRLNDDYYHNNKSSVHLAPKSVEDGYFENNKSNVYQAPSVLTSDVFLASGFEIGIKTGQELGVVRLQDVGRQRVRPVSQCGQPQHSQGEIATPKHKH